ncbi:MAG: hypothetical protein AAF944_04670 [Bacteroidota bacterium]
MNKQDKLALLNDLEMLDLYEEITPIGLTVLPDEDIRYLTDTPAIDGKPAWTPEIVQRFEEGVKRFASCCSKVGGLKGFYDFLPEHRRGISLSFISCEEAIHFCETVEKTHGYE